MPVWSKNEGKVKGQAGGRQEKKGWDPRLGSRNSMAGGGGRESGDLRHGDYKSGK